MTVPLKWAATVALGMVVTATPQAFAQSPKQGGTLRHIVQGEASTNDCHATATSFALQVLSPQYSTLLKFHPDNYPEIVGDLAESWEVSEDGKTYTFMLRDGVTFHDGSTFDSEDIKATFDRLRNPPEGISSSRQGQFSSITSIETPDPLTVTFELSEPNPAQLSIFASPWNCVYSAEKLAENPNYPATEVMGTGPFKFVEYVPGSHWLSERNEDYFVEGQPYLDGVRAEFIGGAGVLNALAGNQVDATFFSISPPDRDRLEAMNPDMVYQTGPFNIVNFLTPNLMKAPFNDKKARQALSLALSRVEGNEFLPKISPLEGFGLYMPANSIAELTEDEIHQLPGFNKDIEAQREEARRLVEETGLDTANMTLLNRNLRQPWEPLGIFILDQWRKVGIEADQNMAATSQYFAALGSGEYDIAIDYNNTVSIDPNEVLVKFLPDSPNNYSGVDDPKLTEFFEAQKLETDEAKRAEIVKEMEAYMLEQAYYIPMFRTRRQIAHHKDVKGWTLPPTTVLNLQHDTTWLDR